MNLRYTILLATLPVGFAIFFLLGGLKLGALFTMLWVDRMVIAYTRILPEFGIELVSFPVIAAGMLYGPYTGFAFGLLVAPLLSAVQLLYKMPPFEYEWPSFIPSPYDLMKGVSAMAAGFLVTLLPPFALVFVCIILKNFLYTVADKIIGYPFRLAYILNVLFTLAVFAAVKGFFF
jgi:hypothetical protein